MEVNTSNSKPLKVILCH